jgi:hypothetical protein
MWRNFSKDSRVDLLFFEKWFKNLSENDQVFLQKHLEWKKEYRKIQEKRILPEGFLEKTMEILEDGSESET